MTLVRLEPKVSLSLVKHSTTKPLRALIAFVISYRLPFTVNDCGEGMIPTAEKENNLQLR